MDAIDRGRRIKFLRLQQHAIPGSLSHPQTDLVHSLSPDGALRGPERYTPKLCYTRCDLGLLIYFTMYNNAEA